MKMIDEFVPYLQGLGLKSQEARVYLACLELGQSTVANISKVASVQRTFVYDILDELNIKGLVSELEIKGKKNYRAISIDRFKKLHEGKLERFEQILPELKALEKISGDRPKVQFFEGEEGIKAAFEDTLDSLRGSEILVYSTGKGFYEYNPRFAKHYLERRVKRNISVRAIAPSNPETLKWTNDDKKVLRTSRLVPADLFPFTNEIDIYGNKVAIISLVGEQLAVIIESDSIAKTQRAIFELAWAGAKTF